MGFEAVSLTCNADNDLRQSPNEGEAESEAANSSCSLDDGDLVAVVAAWPALPDGIKAGILALVRAGR